MYDRDIEGNNNRFSMVSQSIIHKVISHYLELVVSSDLILACGGLLWSSVVECLWFLDIWRKSKGLLCIKSPNETDITSAASSQNYFLIRWTLVTRCSSDYTRVLSKAAELMLSQVWSECWSDILTQLITTIWIILRCHLQMKYNLIKDLILK